MKFLINLLLQVPPFELGVALIAESAGLSPVGEFSKFMAVQCLYSAVITNVCNEKKIGNFITLVFV